ncbi:hypothetical protein SCACP_30550 [Sporomusa carbonis]|uniref:Mu transposase C-terminal domain-containing protein n=1 Tax=Sporomusa carbonis TaxID=3076075 RepID=UPI003A6A8366
MSKDECMSAIAGLLEQAGLNGRRGILTLHNTAAGLEMRDCRVNRGKKNDFNIFDFKTEIVYVNPCGILLHGWFWNDAMTDFIGENVLVRYYMQDLSEAYVFNDDKVFCVLTPKTVPTFSS